MHERLPVSQHRVCCRVQVCYSSIDNAEMERSAHPFRIGLLWINYVSSSPKLYIVDQLSSSNEAFPVHRLEYPTAINHHHCAERVAYKGDWAATGKVRE